MTERTVGAWQGVRIASFPSRPVADLARCYLADHDVDAVVDSDDGNGTQPELGFVTGGAWLKVAPDDVDRARTLLAEVGTELAGTTDGEHADDGDPSTWLPGRRGRTRAVATVVAASTALVGVWTTVVVLLS